MQFNTSRFGSIEIDQDRVITFPDGLPGFPEARQFVFLRHPGIPGPLHWMQCVDETSAASEIAFPVVSPWRIEAEYAPTIPGSAMRELGIDDVRSQAQLWAIVTVPKDRPHDATVNLLAPVLVNRELRRARQVVALTDESALRRPICAIPPDQGATCDEVARTARSKRRPKAA